MRNSVHGQDAIDAPIDGFLMSKKAKNTAGAKQLLTFLGSAAAENTYLKSDANDVGASNGARRTWSSLRASRRRLPGVRRCRSSDPTSTPRRS